MKTRNGFVSNSSSSSFILALKSTEVCPHCGRSDETLLEAVERCGERNDDNCVNGVGAEHILYEINRSERNGYHVSDSFKKKIKSYKNKRAWTVVDVSVSYHCQELNDKIKRMVKDGNAIMIGDENE